jgi:vacuolar-type H+-ATPase subunit D/Vma8
MRTFNQTLEEKANKLIKELRDLHFANNELSEKTDKELLKITKAINALKVLHNKRSFIKQSLCEDKPENTTNNAFEKELKRQGFSPKEYIDDKTGEPFIGWDKE